VYSHALLIASMRTSACNGLHGVQERCARWILMTLDRVDSDGFTVTKEFLAQLLGANRPTVSVLVSVLDEAGNAQRERPLGDRCGSKSAEGSGL
jgi:Crp-like helix-turn-helix domain